MGLLDDAIREHLELKRRHGGDPGEIERQEHEVLGSRDDAVAAEDEPVTGERPAAQAGEPAAGTALYDDERSAPEDFAADAPTTASVPADADPAADEVDPPPGEEEIPTVGHEADAPGYDEDPWLDADEDQPQRPSGGEAPAPAGDKDEDVLEETPEFLQETPEHDRLWFEQKPPRDFDWDR